MADSGEINSGEKTTDAMAVRPVGRLEIIVVSTLLCLCWLFFLCPWVPYLFYQSDTYWLIETGRLILEKHALPAGDIYSYTSLKGPWVAYQWLFEVCCGLANAAGGLSGVAVFGQSILALLCCVLILRNLLRQGINAFVALATIFFAAYAFFPGLCSLRPQLFSFVLFWLLVELCQRVRAGLSMSKTIAASFFIALFWANCHISFLIGLVLLGAHLFAALILALRKSVSIALPASLAGALAAFFAGTFCTPYGPSLWQFIGKTQSMFYSQEVLSTVWSEHPHRFALVVITGLSCLYLRKKMALGYFLSLLALLWLGNSCARLIAYFCLLSCPVVAAALSKLFAEQLARGLLSRWHQKVSSIVRSVYYPPAVVALAALSVLSQPLLLQSNVPVDAAKYLAAHPPSGNLFCTAHAGSYLIYSSRGAIPVFIDTRLDLYDTDFCVKFLDALYGARDWEKLFDQYKIAGALLPHDDANIKLGAALDSRPDWKVVYSDKYFDLYQRR